MPGRMIPVRLAEKSQYSMCLPAICLGGPTGSGKTELALSLAGEFDLEIINADSRQLYAAFPIITAQPDAGELSRAPHHLYGFLPAWQKFSAGLWLERAAGAMRQASARGRIALFVGGTGFYLHALLHGLADIPQTDSSILKFLELELDNLGLPALYARLRSFDPALAARLHPNDRQRILRGLEVFLGTGRPLSDWQKNCSRPAARGPLLVLDASLQWLAPRLERRIELMLEKGALAEAERALANSPEGPAWNGIGCRELRAHLEGRLDLAECRKLWLANTRAYAKRQLTWFRGREEAIFLPESPGEALASARKSVAAFIGEADSQNRFRA